jgi:predicted N-acetyltransferase YhbS
MKASVKVQDDGLMPRKVFMIVAEKGNAIVGAMRYVPVSFKEEAKHLQEGEIPSAGSLRVLKGVGTAMFGEAIKIAAQTGTGRIRIEALSTAEPFWKSQGFTRVKNAKLKENSTYDMTIDADTVQALAKEISS